MKSGRTFSTFSGSSRSTRSSKSTKADFDKFKKDFVLKQKESQFHKDALDSCYERARENQVSPLDPEVMAMTAAYRKNKAREEYKKSQNMKSATPTKMTIQLSIFSSNKPPTTPGNFFDDFLSNSIHSTANSGLGFSKFATPSKSFRGSVSPLATIKSVPLSHSRHTSVSSSPRL
ncbi:hypothetical protein TRFO_10057 [Tritrichomonas foetus]|uniref:Uncharacterized protein n=1 Tax=Tritrichomonas foetus TaxID=1144522 RepID=A0A1J4JB44_9EUKA|nr:hypothetical protein TRFO_10057 [Tritrichomonas foetus]|eukprot:OHS96376.1 hypothetical protein TRFO_10057 [Tritrichomonas foetus]